MTSARSGSGCGRWRWIAGAAVLLVLASTLAGAQPRPACITSCDDPPNLFAACQAFRACQEEVRSAVGACVDGRCQCSEDRPNCRFPITPGRCTITLDCVGTCYSDLRKGLLDAPTPRDCVGDLKLALRSDRDCRLSSAAARRACKKCELVEPIPQACTPAFDERGSRCQHTCVLRTLEHLAISKDCYSKCGARCEGNSCATAMCERACRNSVCKKLRGTCLADDEGDTATEVVPRLKLAYGHCCQNDDCDADDEDTLGCTPTTTSSTSTSSSSTSTASVASTSTSSTTSSTL